MKKFKQWTAAQGRAFLLKRQKYRFEVKSEKEGYIVSSNAEKIGLCAAALRREGRKKGRQNRLPGRGIEIVKNVGDFL